MHNFKRKTIIIIKFWILEVGPFVIEALVLGVRVKYVCVSKSKSKNIFNVFESLVFSVLKCVLNLFFFFFFEQNFVLNLNCVKELH